MHMQHEREIEALLTSNEAGSIVDRLMAMPHAVQPPKQANEWDRAVAGRLEASLVKQMRRLIEPAEGGRKDAA